jgi:Uma2 family endonuclease
MLLYRIPEFNIPEVKPAIEVVHGERFQKVSPKPTHSVLQLALGSYIRTWAKNRGRAGTEWRFYLLPPNEKPSSLVPDIAFVSQARIASIDKAAFERTPFAPDIAVEILSPGDRLSLLEKKIKLYLGNGSLLVVVVDPKIRSVRTIDAHVVRTFVSGEIARSAAFADFEIDVTQLFDEIGENP